MSIIFNEDGVTDCKPPCVAQTFINHNAVLYKIFSVGDDHFVVERPSLKNFYHSGKYFSYETKFAKNQFVERNKSASQYLMMNKIDVAQWHLLF